MSSVSGDLWPQTAEQLLRAERLLEHSLAGLAQAERQRRADRDRVALELEQLLLPLEQFSQAVVMVIEEMARERQDNRLLRWQGQLQQQLTPLDEGVRSLRELVALLDQPLESGRPDAQEQRERHNRQQLQQLLLQRQKQVVQLQAELNALQRQLFAAQAPAAAESPLPDGSDQSTMPSIFS